MSQTVAVVVLDSLRYDIFKNYLRANPNGFLNHLVDSSISFTGATAAAPWSLPSHASIFTGKYPREHGALQFNTRIRDEFPTLVDQLNQIGFTTACFTSNEFVQSDYGFGDWDHFGGHYGHARFPDAHSPLSDEEGIEKIKDALGQVRASNKPIKSLLNAFYSQARRSPALVDDGASSMTKDMIGWLERTPSDDDLFLFCNYMETHVYHKQLSTRLRRLWNVRNGRKLDSLHAKLRNKNLDPDATLLNDDDIALFNRVVTDELRYLEDRLSRLYDALLQQSQSGDCLFILCSDHGDGLGEEGFVYHDFGGVTEPLVRVPLVINSPTGRQEKVHRRASLSWIYSTVLNFVDEHDGPDLADPATYPTYVAAENTGHVMDIIDSPEDVHEYYLEDRLAVYQADEVNRKYVSAGDEYSVYSVETDGIKQTRLGEGGRDIIETFEQRHESKIGTKFEVSESTERRLRDLGYI